MNTTPVDNQHDRKRVFRIYSFMRLLFHFCIFVLSSQYHVNQKDMTEFISKTSDYLSTDEIHRLVRCFNRLRNFRMSLLIEMGTKTLLRYSDLRSIRWKDCLGKDTLFIVERKTQKRREINLGVSLRNSIESVWKQLGNPSPEDFMFHYTIQHTNLLLKQGGRDCKIRNKNISTHSFRKSGSRYIWENNGHSDEYLIKLSYILNHSSTQITRKYLGIHKTEIKNIYESFDML